MSWVVLVLLLAGACGGDDSEESATAPADDAPTEEAATDEVDDSDDSSDEGSNLPCANVELVEVGLGSTTTGEVDPSTIWACHWLQVPDGLDSLTFSLTGLSADLDLTVGYGYFETIMHGNYGELWISSESGMGDEEVVIENPAAGPYFVRMALSAGPATSPFEFSVTADPPTETDPTGEDPVDTDGCRPPATEVGMGEPVSDEITAQGTQPDARHYYCIDITDDVDTFTVMLTELEVDLDLWVRRAGESPTAESSDTSAGGAERTVTIEDAEPGPYYIEVSPGRFTSSAGDSSPYTLEVTS